MTRQRPAALFPGTCCWVANISTAPGKPNFDQRPSVGFTWKGRADIGGLFPLRIRFHLLNARLYALQIASS